MFPTRIISIILTALVVTAGSWFVFHIERSVSIDPVRSATSNGIKIGDKTINVEIARTEAEREQGFSGREELGENDGMLFVFEKRDFYAFWMKDMLFPIDIIWIDKDGTMVDVMENVQPDTYPEFKFISDFLAQYVIEVNAGFFDKHNIKLGDAVDFMELDLVF